VLGRPDPSYQKSTEMDVKNFNKKRTKRNLLGLQVKKYLQGLNPMSPFLSNVVIGKILGDGNLEAASNFRFRVEHSER